MSTRRAEGLRLFDEKEMLLVNRALAAIAESAPADAEHLLEVMERLASAHTLVRAMPSLRAGQQLGGVRRDERTLIGHLCTIDGASGDLDLPLKATLARAYLIGKIHFLRGLLIAVAAHEQRSQQLHELEGPLREELAQAVYTQLAEEILLALLRKPDVAASSKQRAAEQLVVVWENAEIEIDDFCPLLESAWRARQRFTTRLGALLGTSEYFHLVCEDCAPQFLDFFARDEVSLQERQAFEEFLFDMTYEEIEAVRAEMKSERVDAISEEFAERVLGRPFVRPRNGAVVDPMNLYRSYNRRQLAADFRIMAGKDGPRRTAEAYLMIFVLDQPAT